MVDFKCEICGKKHATWEHRIYEKIKLVEVGVPIEHLVDVLPDDFCYVINNIKRE